MATTAMTEETPMRMPSTVRNERSLLARSEATAIRTASAKGMGGPSSGAALVAFDPAVADVDGAEGVVRDVPLVGDEDDGVALGMETLEQAHDLVARGRVQVP